MNNISIDSNDKSGAIFIILKLVPISHQEFTFYYRNFFGNTFQKVNIISTLSLGRYNMV